MTKKMKTVTMSRVRDVVDVVVVVIVRLHLVAMITITMVTTTSMMTTTMDHQRPRCLGNNVEKQLCKSGAKFRRGKKPSRRCWLLPKLSPEMARATIVEAVVVETAAMAAEIVRETIAPKFDAVV